MHKYLFKLKERGSTPKKELRAGLTTFLTMSYILFLQPSILSGKALGHSTGMDFGALFTATCLIAALSSLLIALWGNIPMACAPGMGENFFFVTSLIPAGIALGFQEGWTVALGVVFIAGLLFFLLALGNLGRLLVKAFSGSMKAALIGGIGFFITLIGLENGGVLLKSQSMGFKLNPQLFSLSISTFFLGLFVGIVLYCKKVKSYIFFSILASFLFSLCGKGIFSSSSLTIPENFFSLPPSLQSLWLKLDLVSLFSWKILPMVFALLCLNAFDMTGTLIAGAEEAHLTKKGVVPRLKQALLAVSISSMMGALIGMSTVTPYLESLTGIKEGGRTGLTTLTVSLFFIAALFLSPLILSIGNEPVLTAPALVLVGVSMLKWVKKIDFKDYTETVPSFLVLIGIPFFFSISSGMGVGLICYPVLKLLTRKFKHLSLLSVILALMFLLYFALQN